MTHHVTKAIKERKTLPHKKVERVSSLKKKAGESSIIAIIGDEINATRYSCFLYIACKLTLSYQEEKIARYEMDKNEAEVDIYSL